MITGPVTLGNGVILIREPVVTVKTAAIGFWFYTGSRLETEANRGVTHFTEHMLFKGTKTKSAYDIACAFDRMGGYINAYTEREDVCMYCVVPSPRAGEALSIMCDMAENAVFAGEELEREREVVENEILTAEDDPEDSALDAAENSVWPGQTVSASISGTVKQVESLERDDLAGWYESRFVRGKLCVCIAGDFDGDDAAEKLSRLPEHEHLPAVHAEKTLAAQYQDQKPVWQSCVRFVKSKFRQEQFFLLYPLHEVPDEKSYYTLAVLNAVAGDTMSSRLFQALREKGGWCYNVYSFSTFYADAACWCAYASSARQSAVKILASLHEEMEKLFTHGVTGGEVDAAREHLSGEELMADADIESRMKMLERCYDSGFAFRSAEERTELIRRVTKDDVDQLMKTLFDVGNRSLVVYGPGLSRREKNSILRLYS